MTDPFAQYRKTPLLPQEAVTVETPNEYEAFATKDKLARIKIRRAGDPTHAVSYGCLMTVTIDEMYGTELMLLFNHMLVLATGRNLQSVGSAIAAGTAEYIQEFDLNRWPLPKDSKAPVIESIKVLGVPGGPPLDKGEFKFSASNKGKVH